MKNNIQPQAHYGAIDDSEQAAPPVATRSALAYVQALMQANATPLLLGAGSLLAITSMYSISQVIQYDQLLHQCIQNQPDEAPSAADGGEGNHTLSAPFSPFPFEPGNQHHHTPVPVACQHYDKTAGNYAIIAGLSLFSALFSCLPALNRQSSIDNTEPSLPGPRG